MDAADFIFDKRGSTAYPWAIVHRESQRILVTPIEVDHPQLGPTMTEVLFHRTKRDAKAALEDFLEGR